MSESDRRKIASKAWVEVDFDPDPGFKLLFDGLHGREELGRPFLYTVDLSSGTLRPDISKLVGTSATVWMSQSDPNAPDRYLNGIVTRVVSTGLSAGTYHYRVELRPWIWLLTRVTDCRIFQGKSPFQIITKVFRDAGFSDFKDNRKEATGDTALDYCVQDKESSFDFVTRLMEQYGLYYYFTHDKGVHTLVFADDENAHTKLPDPLPFVFDQTEFRTVADHFWEWSTDLALQSGKFTLTDYNFTKPNDDLIAKTVVSKKQKVGDFPHDGAEVYEYPGPYDVTANGQKLTDVRMQAISVNTAVYQAASNSRKLHAGWKFALNRHPDQAMNRTYLITRAEFSMSIAEGSSSVEGETLDTYRVVIQAIPDTVPFRLERQTPRPMIRGPQTARVAGQTGQEIDTDEYGRVKVRFYWDRAWERSTAKPDDNSTINSGEKCTCWIRVAQSAAAAGLGSIYIPRIGQEVVVEFLEGNPDRPLVTGVVYNATVKVPYPLPDNKTRSTIRTNSSMNSDGYNELRFEDKAGEEEVFFQAQKDFNKKVLNNETVTIHKDTTTTVETGNHSFTVSQGKSTLTINQDLSTTVQTGNHSLSVSAGTSSTTAAQSITLTVGGNSIKMDTTSLTITIGANTVTLSPSGISVSGPQVQLSADATMSLSGGASMSLTAGMISIN